MGVNFWVIFLVGFFCWIVFFQPKKAAPRERGLSHSEYEALCKAVYERDPNEPFDDDSWGLPRDY